MRILLILLGFSLVGFSASKKQNKHNVLDVFIDDWHQAASNADFEAYFGAMANDFYFLGTAPGEKWNKDEFATFSKPYFDKGKAWDFKASNRQWYGDTTAGIVWFDEDLDTWMEDCRGSGVVAKVDGVWKLKYYNLTVLIENEKIQEFIKLRKSE